MNEAEGRITPFSQLHWVMPSIEELRLDNPNVDVSVLESYCEDRKVIEQEFSVDRNHFRFNKQLIALHFQHIYKPVLGDVEAVLATGDLVAEDHIDREESRLRLHYPYLFDPAKPLSLSAGNYEITLG